MRLFIALPALKVATIPHTLKIAPNFNCGYRALKVALAALKIAPNFTKMPPLTSAPPTLQKCPHKLIVYCI